MVQRKAAQKKALKTASNAKAKPIKKTLSNGYKKTDPKTKNTKKNGAKIEQANEASDTETAVKQNSHSPPKDTPENNTEDNVADEVHDSEETVEGKTGKNATAAPAKESETEETVSTKKGRSRAKTNQGSSKTASDDNVGDDAKVKPEEVASTSEGKSRKRKAVAKEEEKPKEIERKSASTKNKAKKQKIVLEVPSLDSFIPGKVFVVGENDCGQIGLDKDVDTKEKPFLLNLPHSIVDIAAGGMHSVCLTESGEVITFGCNDEGALGRVASDEEECIPRKVEIPERIVQISAGDSHSAGLAESGQVYLWGNFRNGEGQMGLTPDGQKRIAPIKILTDKTIVKIASGGDHIACLSNEGVVYTCGCAEQGQLGRVNPRCVKSGGRHKGLASLLQPEEVILKPNKAIGDLWTESYATFVKVQGTNSIFTFGLNNYNQLGLQNRNNDQESQMVFFPQSVPSFSDKSWKQINGGQHHTLALDGDGLVYALGRKEYGRLGLGENCEDTSAPTPIPSLENEKCNSVSCGNTVSYAVTQEGSLYSWGMESSQLGHGSQGNSEDIHMPRLMKGELLNSWEVLKVSGGGQHALILARPKQGNKDKNA